MNKLNFLMALLLIALIPFASAAGVTVVKRELIDSQYGVITDVLGIGNQIYKVTYSDGTIEEVAVSGETLSLGAITDMPQGTDIASTVCYNAKSSVRVKTIQDSTNSFSDTHKIEVWYNDNMMSLDGLLLESRVYTNLKVYDSNAFQSSSSISTPYTIEIPYNNGYAANTEYLFMVVEYQMKKDGTWVRLSNPAFGATTTYTSKIKWWNTYQSGAGRGALTGGSCRYTVPQPPVAVEPTPPPATTRTIQITSNPSGATVTSSGQTLGTTPFSLTLDSGSAKILTFSLAGYPSVAKGVDINSASPMNAAFSLPTTPPPPVVTTVPPVMTTVPPVGTPVVTTIIPGQTTPAPTSTGGSGGMVVETEQPSGGATVTYEEAPIMSSETILVIVVIGVIAVVAYSKLYVQKGGKGKGRK